eukprot:1191052-Prorocentrum_minimum.AAC.1
MFTSSRCAGVLDLLHHHRVQMGKNSSGPRAIDLVSNLHLFAADSPGRSPQYSPPMACYPNTQSFV